ncbi:polysaccharide biosynthesis C-terminal domain-containing protein [Bhargavaea massiliensis]|uniref:oligosaccharide flippase family protein n=1 Tax=Bhargavaea massiliensis TaxID=2697500 RepID=UPI001BD07FBC|nr:polysaccharide biosynthesis C-terminal domain-containing protein [Bhargavaea massiliensis]
MKGSKSLISALKYVFLGNMGQVLISLLATPIIVRLVTPSEFGLYSTTLVVINTLFIIINFGQADAIRRFTPKYINSNDKEKYIATSSYISNLSIVLLFITCTIYFLYTKDLLLTLIIFIYLLLYISISNNSSFLFGMHMQKKSETVRVLMLFLQYSFAVFFALIFSNASGLLIGFVFGLIIPFIVLWINIKNVKESIGLNQSAKGFHKDILKELLFFGRFIVIGTLFAQLLYNADILLIKYFSNYEAVAIYKAAIIVSQLLWMVPKAFQSALIPNIAELWEENKHQDIFDITLRSVKFIFLFMLLCSIGLYVLIDDFVLLYFGKDYIEAINPLKILLIGTVCYGLTRAFDPLIQVSGKLNQILYCSGAAVLINLVLNLLFIPKFGIEGAAIGTSISYIFIFIFKYILVQKMGLYFKIRFGTILKYLLLIIIFIFLLSIFQELIENVLMKIILTAIFGLLSFIVLLLSLKLVSKKELKLMFKY